MATIPNPGSELRHARKTVTFDGSAGNGAVGNVTVFTITGMVMVETLTAHATTSLVSSGSTATLAFGSSGNPSWLTGPMGADLLAADYWWSQNENADAGIGCAIFSPGTGGVSNVTTMQSIILTVAEEAVTDGVLVIDCWYRPLTDDGALAGDDIDQDSRTWFWAQAMADIASVPAITASAKDALNWLFALARNKLTQTATTQTLKKDDGTTTVGTAGVSDDGTTFTRNEWS